jgi:hypothetical protein
MAQPRVRPVHFTGTRSVDVWLHNIDAGDPVIFPEWPQDYPAHVPLWLQWLKGQEPLVCLVLDRAAMLEQLHPDRLWFCHVPLEAVLANTDAKRSWFE